MNTLATNWLFWSILSAVFAALTALFAKAGVADIDPNLATFIRTGVVLIALAVLLWATGGFEAPAKLSRSSLIFLVISGLATGASWLCYFQALKWGEVSRVAPVDKLSVVLVAVFGVVFLGEHLSLAGWFGVAMIACGAVVMAVS
jgi:transporter family protein